jgi:hypothetical protein
MGMVDESIAARRDVHASVRRIADPVLQGVVSDLAGC